MIATYHGRRQRPADLDERRGGHGAKEARNAAMVADYLSGVEISALAKRYGISQQRTHIILGNAGVVTGGAKRRTEEPC